LVGSIIEYDILDITNNQRIITDVHPASQSIDVNEALGQNM
jgi:hypothetical protein